MTGSETTVTLAVLGGIALFTGLLTVVAVKLRRADDAAALALRAATVQGECRPLLVAPDFLWGVWQDTAKAAAMRFLVRDTNDAEVATVTKVAVPLDGVLKHFILNGRVYDIRKAGLMSNRTCLREAGRDEVLLSADHYTGRTEIFRGDGAELLFVVPMVSVFRRYRPVKAGGEEIGKVIIGLKGHAYAAVMTLPEGRYSMLERVFTLASL